ncbi:MAG: NYN domain-containing protein [Isosphaeraceae bacterium]
MLWLIDGYNLMHAAGVLGSDLISREAFRRKRRRFLNTIADAMGAERAHETTVVFDASTPPSDFPLESSYKGMTLIFALEDESADARIERLIAAHSAPKSLTVVSSDRQIRQAATRRRARTLSADEFLDLLERFQSRRRQEKLAQNHSPVPFTDRDLPLSAEEVAYWLAEFRELDAASETRDAFAPDSALLTDAEIDRIQREIDSEA